MNKLIFRCYGWNEKGGWHQLEDSPSVGIRNKPQWIPRFLWDFLLWRILFWEAVLEEPDGYIDATSVTVGEVE